MVICLERGADLHMVQLMPLPLTVSCFSKIQIGFTFLVPAHPDSPGKRAVKWVCVGVYGGFSWQFVSILAHSKDFVRFLPRYCIICWLKLEVWLLIEVHPTLRHIFSWNASSTPDSEIVYLTRSSA